MTPDERKAWELIIRDIPEVGDDVPWFLRGPEKRAILAADAELKSCHEIMEREGKELIHLRIVVASQVDMTKLFKERWELEQIRYEGISSANEELRARVAVLEDKLEVEHDVCMAAITVANDSEARIRELEGQLMKYGIGVAEGGVTGTGGAYTCPDCGNPVVWNEVDTGCPRKGCKELKALRATLDAAKEGK